MNASSTAYLNVETQLNAIDVEGWHPHRMRVSIATVATTNQLHVFREAEVQQLASVLESAECVIGWNLTGFDFKVLSGYPGVNLERVRCLDLMEEVEKVTGVRPSLTAVSTATLGIQPDMDGLEMVELWKAGKIEKVVEGCCNVVLAIKALHEYRCREGKLFYYPPNSKRRKSIKV